MDFTEITNDDQYNIIAGRLKQYEIQYLNTQQNLLAATALKQESDTKTWTDKLTDLEVRCKVERDALSKLKKPAVSSVQTGQVPRQHQR